MVIVGRLASHKSRHKLRWPRVPALEAGAAVSANSVASAACMEPVAEAPKRSLNPIKAVKSLFSKGKKAKLELNAEDIDECVVNSESAEEREQCQ